MNYDNFTKEQIVSILKDTLEYSSKLREEIERLNTDKEQLNSLVNFNQKEIRRLHSIINEVREYIKENAWYDYRENEEVITISKEKLLEILDKVKKCEETN